MSGFEVALLIGMALITFATRYTLFAAGHRVRFNRLVTQALNYVPVSVLTAIFLPAMVMPGDGGWQLSLNNAYLVGGIAAIVIAYLSRSLLTTIFGGMLVFFCWRWLFGA